MARIRAYPTQQSPAVMTTCCKQLPPSVACHDPPLLVTISQLYALSSPVVTLRHPLSLFVTHRHSSSPVLIRPHQSSAAVTCRSPPSCRKQSSTVVTRSPPSSLVITRPHQSSTVVICRIPARHCCHQSSPKLPTAVASRHQSSPIITEQT
jgi:hypothetical protein